MAFYFIFLIFYLENVKAFINISLNITNVDDCIHSVKLENDNILYQRIPPSCIKKKFFEDIHYEIGQKLNIEISDIGGKCFFIAYVKVNEHIIYTNDANFWKCENCQNNSLNQLPSDLKFSCYTTDIHKVNSSRFDVYYFYFYIDKISQLDLDIKDISEYYYYLNEANYFFISPSVFNEKIDLIDLHSINNLYTKNKKEIITPFYDYIYYKLFFYEYFFYRGKFYGSDESNNDLILNEVTYSRIFPNKLLRYELSDEEKENNGAHVRIRIGIFNNEKKQVSVLQEFNFFICLKGYKFCDLETSLKCLKEGYYQLNNRYYSCYETCKTCTTYKKPDTADYFNNYCDECKEEYSYYINIIKDENGNKKKYKSCYKECPPHSPILKDYRRKECVPYCPRYKTNDGGCVDNCDYDNYKYLLKDENICYNYIPDNFFIFIDNYNVHYNNTDKPIVKLGKVCPDDTYDSSFNYFCINIEEDFFHFIKNPNELISFNNPLIKRLDTKKIIIRAYSSDKKLDNINNNKNQLIQIDISNCENKIRKKYQFNKEKLLIFHDVFNIETENYFFRVFTKEGEELNYSICNKEDIIIRELKGNIQRAENATKCPKDFPYLRLDTNQCLENCEIISFISQNCITDDLTEDNQMNNINNIRNAIEEHSLDYLLDNITKGGNDLTIVENNIKYQISSSWNQINNNYENISNINLGKCENILKEKYNISLNVPLLIFKLDIDVEGYPAPLVEYEIYNPITKKKLNLKYCQNEQINISIPASIDKNELFKYNPKSEFYNDICSNYTTNYKTDISLKDRQNEFLNQNLSICENDCNYASYNSKLKKVECKCNVKYRIKDLNEIKIDNDKLKANFNFKNLINIKVLKCYKKVFTKNGLFHNIGSYILLSIIFLYIVSLAYLIFSDYSSLKSDIKGFFNLMQDNKGQNDIEIKKIENKNNSIKMKPSIYVANKKLLGKNIQYPKPIFYKLIKNNKTKSNYSKQNRNKIKSNNSSEQSNFKLTKKIPEINLTEVELNNSSYINALLYDKRLICQYFCSLLKFEHLLFFAIIPSKDYNSRAIKICIFLFTFALFFTNNAIFMNEDVIHNIYENHGGMDLIYQIPIIIYSNIISFILDKIIRFFSLTQEHVINLKLKSKIINKNKSLQKFFTVILIKYIFFFVISFLFLFCFWFYISCFCYVYRNTQIYLIKDTLFSFGLSLISPFIFYLISAILRIYSLKKRNRNIIYMLSNFVLF